MEIQKGSMLIVRHEDGIVRMDEDRTPAKGEKRKRVEKPDRPDDEEHENIVVKGNELVLHSKAVMSPRPRVLMESSDEEDPFSDLLPEEAIRRRTSTRKMYANDVFASSQEETEADSDYGVKTLYDNQPISADYQSEGEDFQSVGSRSLTSKSSDGSHRKPTSPLSTSTLKKKQRASKKLAVPSAQGEESPIMLNRLAKVSALSVAKPKESPLRNWRRWKFKDNPNG
ncbi:hypothetical protein CBR_g30503 [Chara braunii]|uniref:Uncharacterized protein n=1 Tax=Chara braunii TaxID=69332 RepID=A0A388LCS5_CHABU|nr:hypothetical protein CBR_g30503 [Chara braunii]|eukprot:GBG80135.1 hypothetical protein CBR_g30503 [Chara braunii]